jgi:hypothetical protein
MRLNIVTDDTFCVHDALIKAFNNSTHGVRVYLANRPAKGIVEFDFVSSEPCCISLESIREALPFIEDYNIRIVI